MNSTNSVIKQVVEIPVEQFDSLVNNQNLILGVLEDMKALVPPEYLTAAEFMDEVKIRRWKFNQLREAGKLQVIQRGNKLYVKSTEVKRYFQGEME